MKRRKNFKKRLYKTGFAHEVSIHTTGRCCVALGKDDFFSFKQPKTKERHEVGKHKLWGRGESAVLRTSCQIYYKENFKDRRVAYRICKKTLEGLSRRERQFLVWPTKKEIWWGINRSWIND